MKKKLLLSLSILSLGLNARIIVNESFAAIPFPPAE